jgi:hypothetical protein
MAIALEVLNEHPTWNVLDSSKLTCYMACPRKYFFRYLAGWHSASPNNHLVFGSAWHVALEHLHNNAFTQKAILEAQVMFLEHYRQTFPVETDELFSPKTAPNGAISIEDYARKFLPIHREHEVLYTELGGVVLVTPTRTMTFKCDAILRNEKGQIFALDHKTSQRKLQNWGNYWTLSTQMLTYLHALHCLYPDQDEITMLVRCAFFYKSAPTIFEEHPINKSHEQMQAWLERTNQWIDRMHIDMDILTNEDNTDESVMRSFPQNDTACFDYGRQCEFFDFCNAWPNPLQRVDEVPIGFALEWWDPLAQPEIRTRVDLSATVEKPNATNTKINSL